MKKICVIGLGYIGLPTASLLATKKFRVLGVDCKKDIIDMVNKGNVHIYEPGLDILVKTAVDSGNFRGSIKPEIADVFIISVPTPFKENHTPDLKYVEEAVLSIAPYIKNGNLVILESTSPVGTTEKIGSWIKQVNENINIPTQDDLFNAEDGQVYIAYCPERVLPGKIIKELAENDRIVGGIDSKSAKVAKKFYENFVSGNVFETNARTAEMVKLTENSFRDVNIAFANELSLICDQLKIDVWELIKLANKHPRVNILQPGPGVGGHCIAVDPWFIIDAVPEKAKIIRVAREVNDNKPEFVISKIEESIKSFVNPKIAMLGLSFKADIDDLRESPALSIVERLANNNNFPILVVEPHIEKLPASLEVYKHVFLCAYSEALQDANIIVLLVNHKLFYKVNKKLLNNKIVIDTRGIWNNHE